MTISTRLALTYSIIASSIFVVFGISVFVFSSNYGQDNFKQRLKQRVLVTEKMFLEKETFSPRELEKITNEFLHTLPQETEEVIKITSNKTPDFKHTYSQKVRSKFLTTKEYHYTEKEVQGMSRIFTVNGIKYVIVVTAVDEIGLQNLSFLRRRIILLILIGIPIIFIGGFLITRRALLPLSKKIGKANSISASNLHQRLNVQNPNDEIGKLAIAFNNLLDRLETSFESQKAFISNASHEINTPLTSIIGEAEVTISKPRTEKEYVQSLRVILSEGEMLSNTTKNLLQLSKITANEGNLNFTQINFTQFIYSIKESFDFFNPDNQISIENAPMEKGDKLIVFGNQALLMTAVINLLDNACKFSSNKEVVVKLFSDGNSVCLTIIDNGIGIAENDLDKVNNPFFRGINALQIRGSGIGLSLSSQIIQLHNGTLEFQSQLEKGTNVLVKLQRFSN
ncbi:MAG: hypothetical protein COA38_19030 [Fluviicola sp.]|nr:MAG: hypothetical protein COA38_19030 [Fluviicola sp.]